VVIGVGVTDGCVTAGCVDDAVFDAELESFAVPAGWTVVGLTGGNSS
jgi:hypothetical protein